MSIIADIGRHGCDVFDRNEIVQKAPKQDFWTYWSVLGASVARKTLRDSLGELLLINANIGIYWHVGDMFFTGMKKFKKHQNMIFGHIGVYWVRSWQKLTS